MPGMALIKRFTSTRAGSALVTFFGNKDNAAVAKHLRELSAASRECATELHRGSSMNLDTITDYEHAGDDALEALSLALERSFILQETLRKADATHLGHEMDDVIDGMRDVANHLNTYRGFLPELPRSCVSLIEIVYTGAHKLDKLVVALTDGRIDFRSMNRLRTDISQLERDADTIKRDEISRLVNHEHFDDFRAYEAQRDLINRLEGITDNVKHCAVIVMSMARQEV